MARPDLALRARRAPAAGFLDGWRGYAHALIAMDYVRQKYLTLYVMSKACPVAADWRAG